MRNSTKSETENRGGEWDGEGDRDGAGGGYQGGPGLGPGKPRRQTVAVTAAATEADTVSVTVPETETATEGVADTGTVPVTVSDTETETVTVAVTVPVTTAETVFGVWGRVRTVETLIEIPCPSGRLDGEVHSGFVKLGAKPVGDCNACYGCCGTDYLCKIASNPFVFDAARSNWLYYIDGCFEDFANCPEQPDDPPDSGGQVGDGSETS